MDTHTATSFQFANTKNPNIIYSTAEWSKFSPSVYEALSGNKTVGDTEAIAKLESEYNITLCPTIAKVMSKEIIHKEHIQKEEIEKSILKFL